MADLQRLVGDLERAAAHVSPQELLEYSPYARLKARLKTMPVIEQAKGIIIAESHCGEAEAFDLLRRASQRSNVPVRDLATEIVACSSRTPTPAARPRQAGQDAKSGSDPRLFRAS